MPKKSENGTSESDAAELEISEISEISLMAVTPIDGRYHARTRALAAYFSEFGLIRYRVRIEIEWLFALAKNPALKEFALDPGAVPQLRSLYTEFSIADARRVKAIERETNHDVKAVEYFVKERSRQPVSTFRSGWSTSPAPRRTSTTSPTR